VQWHGVVWNLKAQLKEQNVKEKQQPAMFEAFKRSKVPHVQQNHTTHHQAQPSGEKGHFCLNQVNKSNNANNIEIISISQIIHIIVWT
jgi:hypothetical protein